MSDTEQVITRAYEAELEIGDGRTIVGRIVPFDVAATVADPAEGGLPYQEIWRAGAFRHVVRDAGRVSVFLNYEHRTDLGNQIGRAVSLEERTDGLYGEFRPFDSGIGEHGLELVRSGACTGLSMQAVVPRRARRLEDGTVERTLAKRLEAVALTSTPAYAGAGVLAVRSEPEGLELPAISDVRAFTAAARLRYAPKS